LKHTLSDETAMAVREWAERLINVGPLVRADTELHEGLVEGILERRVPRIGERLVIGAVRQKEVPASGV
jgi:hypothetical protein